MFVLGNAHMAIPASTMASPYPKRGDLKNRNVLASFERAAGTRAWVIVPGRFAIACRELAD